MYILAWNQAAFQINSFWKKYFSKVGSNYKNNGHELKPQAIQNRYYVFHFKIELDRFFKKLNNE